MILDQKKRCAVRTGVDVFEPDDDDEVRKYYKLFKNLKMPLGVKAIHHMFEAECEAFELVRSCPDIAHYVPPFKRVVIERVVAEKGRDVSDDYFLDCCYSTGAAEGCVDRAWAILDCGSWGETLAAKLDELEIKFWRDGEVF